MNEANRRWLALGVLCLPTILLNVDNTVLSVAIPSLLEHLQPSGSQLLWILDAYGLTFACGLLAAGTCGDRFGHRRVLLAGLALFALGSAVSALAGSPGELIGARAVTGVGAALVYPTTLAVIVALFEEGPARSRAISVWVSVSSIGIVIGPLVGGALIDTWGWPAAFAINVPVAAIAILFVLLGVRDVMPHERRPLDVRGLVFASAALVVILFATTSLSDAHVSVAQIGGAFALGGVLASLFVRCELRSDHPLIDTSLFRRREYVGASATIAATYFALVGWTMLLTQYVQYVLHTNALGAGLALVPMAAGQLLGSQAAPSLIRFAGRNGTVVLGIAFVTAATGAFLVGPLVGSMPLVLANRFAEGVGLGLIVVPTTDSVLRSARQGRVGMASAVNDTTRLTSAILGVAVLGAIFTTRYRAGVGSLNYLPGDARGHARSSAGAALEIAGRLRGAAGRRVETDALGAFTGALHVTTAVSVALLVLVAVGAARLLPARDALTVQTETPNILNSETRVSTGGT